MTNEGAQLQHDSQHGEVTGNDAGCVAAAVRARLQDYVTSVPEVPQPNKPYAPFRPAALSETLSSSSLAVKYCCAFTPSRRIFVFVDASLMLLIFL